MNRYQENRRMNRIALSLVAVVALLVSPGAAHAQASQSPLPGYLAKASLARAQAEARKWRPEAYVFQISANRVTDGVAMWNYDFYAAGAGDEKCLRVGFGRGGKPYTSRHKCEASPEVKAFTIDSDKAVDIARKAGLQRPELTMVLSVVPFPGAEIVGWTVMEGAGMKAGEKTADIDATTGEVRGTRAM